MQYGELAHQDSAISSDRSNDFLTFWVSCKVHHVVVNRYLRLRHTQFMYLVERVAPADFVCDLALLCDMRNRNHAVAA